MRIDAQRQNTGQRRTEDIVHIHDDAQALHDLFIRHGRKNTGMQRLLPGNKIPQHVRIKVIRCGLHDDLRVPAWLPVGFKHAVYLVPAQASVTITCAYV